MELNWFFQKLFLVLMLFFIEQGVERIYDNFLKSIKGPEFMDARKLFTYSNIRSETKNAPIPIILKPRRHTNNYTIKIECHPNRKKIWDPIFH